MRDQRDFGRRAFAVSVDAAVALLAAGLLVFLEHEQVIHTPGASPLDAVAYAEIAGSGLVLTLRRLLPLLTYAATVLLTCLFLLGGHQAGAVWLASLAALLNLVAVLPLLRWSAAALAGTVLLGVTYIGTGGSPLVAALWAGAWLFIAALFAAGLLVRRRFIVEAQARAELAQRTRDERALRRMAEERLNIAREMHDVVGHSLAVISLQAGVAEHLLDSRPEEVRKAVAAIRKVSREALSELRAELATLRGEGAPAERRPAPDLRALPNLIAAMRDAGLDVELDLDGDEQPVPEIVAAAAYRIAQESLTNVARHGGAGAHAKVRVHVEGGQLEVEVSDDGRGAASAPSGAGIEGMRERVRALGGRFTAGNRPQGGFQVRASIPSPSQ
jgi:signal transduction histidine kinase